MVCTSGELLSCLVISVVFLHLGTNGSHAMYDMITFTSTGHRARERLGRSIVKQTFALDGTAHI